MEKCPQVSTLKPEVISFRFSRFGSKKLEEKPEDAVLPKLEDKEEDLDDLFANYKEEQAEIKAATMRWEEAQATK